MKNVGRGHVMYAKTRLGRCDVCGAQAVTRLPADGKKRPVCARHAKGRA